MRGNSDRDTLYPLAIAPVGGWGNSVEGDTRAIITFVPRLGAGVKLTDEGDGYAITSNLAEATVFDTQADAALAAAKLIEAAANKRSKSEEALAA